MRRLATDRRGHASILLAAGLAMLLGTAALGIDTGLVFLEKRRIQGIADAAALAAAASPADARAAAAAAIAASPGAAVTLQAFSAGDYDPDPAIPPADRFTAAADGPAVRVTVRGRAPLLFGRALGLSAPTEIVASASATRLSLAGFAIGTRVAAVQGGLGNAMLSALAGSDLRLTVLDCQALAGGRVDLLAFVAALRTQLNMDGATFAEVLAARATAPQVVRALAAAADPVAAPILGALAGRVAARPVPLDALIDLGPLGLNLRAGSAPPIVVDALSLLRATLEIGGGSRIAASDAMLGLPGLASAHVQVAIGARVAHSPFVAISAARRITIRTGQMRLTIEAQLAGTAPLGLGAMRLPLYVDLAPAEATLADVSCAGGRNSATATLDVTPSLGTAAIAEFDGALGDFSQSPRLRPATIVRAPLATATAYAELRLGRRTRTVVFDAQEIAAATAKTVTTDDLAGSIVRALIDRMALRATAAGVGLDPGTVTATLGPALIQAAGPLDALLAQAADLAGVGVGQADVWVNGVRCGTPVLIG